MERHMIDFKAALRVGHVRRVILLTTAGALAHMKKSRD
jgi:hypothetical protein